MSWMVTSHTTTGEDCTPQLYQPNRRQVLKTSVGTFTAISGLTGTAAITTANEHDDPPEDAVEELRSTTNSIEELSGMVDAAVTCDIRQKAIEQLGVAIVALEEDELDDAEPYITIVENAHEANERASNHVVRARRMEAEQAFDESVDYVEELQDKLVEAVNDHEHLMYVMAERMFEVFIDAGQNPRQYVFTPEDEEDLVNVDEMETFLDLLVRTDYHINRIRDEADRLRKEGFGVSFSEEDGSLVVEGADTRIGVSLRAWAWMIVGSIFTIVGVVMLSFLAGAAGTIVGYLRSLVIAAVLGITLYHVYGVLTDEYDSWEELYNDIEPIYEPIVNFLTEHVLPPLETFKTHLLEQLSDIDPEDVAEAARDAAEALITTAVEFARWLIDTGLIEDLPETLIEVWTMIVERLGEGQYD